MPTHGDDPAKASLISAAMVIAGAAIGRPAAAACGC